MSNLMDNERLEKALQYAKASLAIEGQYLTSEEEELVRTRMLGEITHEEFLDLALKLAKQAKESPSS